MAVKQNWRKSSLDLNREPVLPFNDNIFSIATLLAVVEHLNPKSMALLFSEIRRVLEPGGVVILTTPAAWSDGLLHLMSRLSLVSAEETNEHAYAYTLPLLGWYFGQASFHMEKIRFGYFEFSSICGRPPKNNHTEMFWVWRPGYKAIISLIRVTCLRRDAWRALAG